MSKIPIDKNGKLRALELRGLYATNHTKIKSFESLDTSVLKGSIEQPECSKKDEINTKVELKEHVFGNYSSLLPKMNINLENVVEKNPRILDLREKLNAITKSQDRNVDKKTKGLINDITQLVDDKDQDGSGPYSLLFDLKPDPTASNQVKPENNVWGRPKSGGFIDSTLQSSNKVLQYNSINKSVDRLPNVLNFDEKPMKEFEYSCESEVIIPVKKVFNTHSRSDLCLQLKSHIIQSRTFEPNISPNDNSLSRNNEENSLDDSLGILTPDQMDDICYLENAFSPTVEGLPIFCDNNENKNSPDNGDTPSTDKTESNSAASAIQNEGYDCIESENVDNIKTCECLQAPTITFDTVTNSEQSNLSGVDNNTTPNVCHKPNCGSISHDSSPPLIQEVNPGKENNDLDKGEFSILLEEEFMPSIHSSILEPVSSIGDNTVNLEINLEKHVKCIVTNRLDQTPSPEDLPLDSSDINGEISTYSQFSASTLHDSNTFSDIKNDYTKSMDTSKVSNSFITSITSITSLDGYQGDGEMSRPVSRGADHSIAQREDVLEMDWQNVPVTRRVDPMTDSDFFTESDADGLDDHMQRGDRRAQVIDGALYRGKNGIPSLIVNRNDDSCMESSGVYTDFENHRASPVFLNVIDDLSPEGSTPSTRSECSQKNASDGSINTYFAPTDDALDSNKEIVSQVEKKEEKPQITSKRNSLNNDKENRVVEKAKEEKRFTLKKYKMPKRDVPSKLKSMLAYRKIETDASVQSSPKAVKKTERRENVLKKNSSELKNDFKTKSFKDVKSKVDCSFSLQRSQTSCSVGRTTSTKSTNINPKPKSRHMRMRMDLGSANGSGKSSLHSSQSDISATSTPIGKHSASRFPLLRNGKKRENVPAPLATRPAPTPPQPQPVQVKKNGVVQKLSASPVSVRSRTSLAPPPSPRKPPAHRVPAQRPTTLPTCKEPPRVATAVAPRGKAAQTAQAVRTPTAPVAAPPAPLNEKSDALAHAAKGVEALGVLVQYLVFRLDAINGGSWRLEAERWRSVAAAERSSAERADRDRQQRAQKDLDTIAECLSKISELEVEVTTKEEANARLQASHFEAVSALASDIKGLKDTIDTLKHEVAESRARLHAHSEIERTLRAQLEAARAELERQADRTYDISCDQTYNKSCDKSCSMSDAACDPVLCEEEEYELRLSNNEELSTDANELAAEVRSLRAVIEMKQAEMASLREARSSLCVERERRAAAERDLVSARHAAEELRERAAARQRDADRLRDDCRRLRDAANRDRDHAARLAALNEELRYKLRQKSQVVSLLAGGGYMGRARSPSGSGRSSPADSPPSPAASPATSPTSSPAPPLPAVKAVVEKHDSVSWVLEIEESPEEVASRLARRSSFRSAGSVSGCSSVGGGGATGVKRRGGGSPGGSPAPASPAPNASKLFRGDLDFPPPPPPLKESAGEAIYIYDDRQY